MQKVVGSSPIIRFAESPAYAGFFFAADIVHPPRMRVLAGAHRREYDRAIEWAQMGTNDELERVLATAEATKNPA